jgi:multiubiquitin
MTNEARAKTTVKIEINEKKYKVESPTTGAHLRELGNVPATNELFRETRGGGPDELIRPDGTYELKEDDEFYDLPKGTVG